MFEGIVFHENFMFSFWNDIKIWLRNCVYFENTCIEHWVWIFDKWYLDVLLFLWKLVCNRFTAFLSPQMMQSLSNLIQSFKWWMAYYYWEKLMEINWNKKLDLVYIFPSDVPLLPVIGSKGDQQFNFQLHWLNNKELQFTMEAEIILQDMHKGVLNVDSHGDEHGNHEASDSDHEDHHLDDIEKSGKRQKRRILQCNQNHLFLLCVLHH